MENSSGKACLLLHKKSCNRPDVKEAVRAVRNQAIDLSVCIPWRRKDQTDFIKNAIKAGVTRIIAGGGDGTLNGVVNALMKKNRAQKASLGVMPLGTANDFARGAGVPLDDLAAALHLAATSRATPIDIGQVNGRYFINVVSGGFGAEVTATTPQELKGMLGGAAYTLMGLVKALQLKPYTGRLTLPDGTVEEGSIVVMAVGNNRFAGGAFEVAPRANLTDGLLDLAELASAETPTPAAIASEFADPFNKGNKFLRYRQLASFKIESDRPLHTNLDGEPLIDDHFEFSVHHRALPVVLGP